MRSGSSRASPAHGYRTLDDDDNEALIGGGSTTTYGQKSIYSIDAGDDSWFSNGKICQAIRRTLFVATVLLLLAGAALLASKVYSPSSISDGAGNDDDGASNALGGDDNYLSYILDNNSTTVISFGITNPDYDTPDSYSDLADYYEFIAEPHREHTYELRSLTVEDEDIGDDDVDEVIWSIDGNDYYGDSVSVTIAKTTIEAPDGIEGIVTIHLASGYSYVKEFVIRMKYIRRNILTLTDTDKLKWVTAMRTLYDTSQDDGQSLYGDKYLSAEYLLWSHLNGAGKLDCDHWHDGASIVTHHMAFTLACEQSLQSIDPSITMPYWEYGQDAYLSDEWYDSDVFADDLLGIATPLNDDHTLDTGTFANIKMPSGGNYLDWDVSVEKTLNPFVNAYGYMRSPWNNNPSNILSRFNLTYTGSTTTMPDCDLMMKCFNSNSLESMNDCLNGVTHGPVHILMGGLWGQRPADLWDDKDVSFLNGIDKLLFFKMLWRAGFTRCPISCSKKMDNEDCACAVPDEYIDTYGALYMLNVTGVLANLGSRVTADSSDDYVLKVLRAMEDPGIAGEMFSSAAPYDPSFWPLHGQLERVLSYKRIKNARGDFRNTWEETWGYSTANNRYLQGICDWSAVQSADDLTLPMCEWGIDKICSGHNEYDELEFGNFQSAGETYTNHDFYDYIAPWNNSLPYIYDTYNFQYCIDEGYSYDD